MQISLFNGKCALHVIIIRWNAKKKYFNFALAFSEQFVYTMREWIHSPPYATGGNTAKPKLSPYDYIIVFYASCRRFRRAIVLTLVCGFGTGQR